MMPNKQGGRHNITLINYLFRLASFFHCLVFRFVSYNNMVWETKKKIIERGKHDGSILVRNIVGILPLILGTKIIIPYYGLIKLYNCSKYTYWIRAHIWNIRISSIRSIKHLSNSRYPLDGLCSLSDKVFPLHQRHQTNTANCLLNE